MRRRRRADGERGIALIAVLWVGVVLGALAAAVVALSRGDIDLARSQRAQAQAELAADSAALTAIYALVNNAQSAITTDGSVAAWRVPGAELRVEVSSEYGRIDLNRAPPALMAALLVQAGATKDQARSLAAAIVDFADRDDLLTPMGAERREYAAAGLPGPKNAPFEAEDELLGVLGMTGDLYRRIADAVTVYTGRPQPSPGQEQPLVRAALTGDPGPALPPLPPAFSIQLGAAPQTLRRGSLVSPASALVRIRAECETQAGIRAARVAVVSLRGRGRAGYKVLGWHRARPELFPPRPPQLPGGSARG